MRPEEIEAMIDARVASAIAAHNMEISEAIAFGLRTYADRPVGEKGSPSLQYGVVDSVESTWAMVLLDGQTDAVPINMLGGLVVGERVAVLLVPPSGNLAIGMVSPAVVGSLPPGGTATQVLTKIDATDGNADWETPSAGGGFPVGPLDDGVATYLLGEPAPLPTGGISGMLLSGLSDANGGEAQLSIGFAGSGVIASAGMHSNTNDGSEADISVGVQDTSHASAAMNVQANGGSSASVSVESDVGNSPTSAVSFDADRIMAFNLPTSDPGITDQLYKDAITGIVKISL